MLPTNTHILYPEFDYFAPTMLYEATTLLAEYGPDAQVMAGGTDLLVQMKMERRQPSRIISLAKIPALQGIKTLEDASTEIGATTRIRSIYHSQLARHYSALTEACNWFSTVQIMHMATLGGNVCNASPAADSAPCLLVFDAEATLVSKTQERTVALSDFFLGPGRTLVQPDELLTRIRLPAPPPQTGSAFIKISRVAADISQVCAAVRVTRDGNLVREARIALGSVAPTPVRVVGAERALVGEPFTATLAEYVGGLAAREIKPISDVRASLEYRQTTAAVIVRDALLRAWDRAA